MKSTPVAALALSLETPVSRWSFSVPPKVRGKLAAQVVLDALRTAAVALCAEDPARNHGRDLGVIVGGVSAAPGSARELHIRPPDSALGAGRCDSARSGACGLTQLAFVPPGAPHPLHTVPAP